MKKLIFIPFLFTLVLTACHPKGSAGSGDADFQKLADEYLKGYLDWRPSAAVQLGFHEYDGKFEDYSKTSVATELARLKKYDSLFAKIDSASLSQKVYYDYRVLALSIKNEMFYFEDMGYFVKNPMTYGRTFDLNLYIKRNFAPLEDRVRDIIEVEKTAPKFFADAKESLADSLPKPYLDLAIKIAQGDASFLQNDMMVALKDVKDTALMAQLKEVNTKAIAAVNDYATWLEKEKLPKAHNHYAIGEANYKKMLAYSENIHMSPDEILAVGMKELKRVQDLFNAAAKVIDPNKKPTEVYAALQKEHPTAETLIPDAKKNLEAIRQFLIDKKICTMPSEVRIQVKETPLYDRETSTASMDAPGAFEKKATEAYYYITPVDPKWTPQQQEDWLAQFNYYTTDIVTIHEAYPGHYTQFLHLNASNASKIQKIFNSYAYTEGWAHYTEQMMIDEGYGASDSIKAAKYRMAQSGEALLRICRLVVSINTHCHGWSVDQGTKFFMDNWYQGDKPSRQEALRGTFDPGYLFYTVGKLEFLKLREDYKKQEGANYTLQKFNDAMMDNGQMPIEMLREVLLKDKSEWEKIL